MIRFFIACYLLTLSCAMASHHKDERTSIAQARLRTKLEQRVQVEEQEIPEYLKNDIAEHVMGTEFKINQVLEEQSYQLGLRKLSLQKDSFDGIENLKKWEERFNKILTCFQKNSWDKPPTPAQISHSMENSDTYPSTQEFKELYVYFQSDLILIHTLMSIDVRGEVEYKYIYQSIVNTMLGFFEKLAQLNEDHKPIREPSFVVSMEDPVDEACAEFSALIDQAVQEDSTEYEDLKNLVNVYKKINQDIVAKNSQLAESLTASKNLNQEKESVNQQLNQKLIDSRKLNQAYLDKLMAFKKEKETLELQKENLLKAEISTLDKNHQLIQQSNDLKGRNNLLAQQNKNLQNLNNDFKNKNMCLSQEKEALKVQNEELSLEKSAQAMAYTELQQRHQQLEFSLTEKEESYESILEKNKELVKEIKQIDRDKNALAENLRVIHLQHEQESASLKDQLTNFEQEKNDVNAKNLELSQTLAARDQEIADLRQYVNLQLQYQLQKTVLPDPRLSLYENRFQYLEDKIKLQNYQIESLTGGLQYHAHLFELIRNNIKDREIIFPYPVPLPPMNGQREQYVTGFYPSSLPPQLWTHNIANVQQIAQNTNHSPQ